MSEALTERFEMRLSEKHTAQLEYIKESIKSSSKADTVRYLVDRRHTELIGGETNASE